MKTLTRQEIENSLKSLHSDWILDGIELKREIVFKDFTKAFAFMTQIAFVAEKDNHHPDWCNSYNKVHISLTTHEAKGLTAKDFQLAGKIDRLLI